MSVKSLTELTLYVVLTMPTLNKAYLLFIIIYLWYKDTNHISSVKVSVLTLSAVDRGFSRVKPKTVTLVFATSPPSMQYYGIRANTGWLESE